MRKRCEKSLNLLKVLSNTSWGADRTSLLRVYQAIVLSRIDYGCVAYGSACNSTLKKLDPIHHMALRICSGAFRTSPVQSLYVNCYQLPLDIRRRKLSLALYFKILSVPSHPLQNVYMSTSMERLYDARPSNIRPFMDRMKLHISELDLPHVHIQQRNLFLFQPWNTPRFHYINPFASYSKSTVAPFVFQRVFAYHRSQYSRYSAIYTDGSKRADYVGCGVVIEDIMHGYRLDTSCSIFTAEAVAIYRALQLIDSNMPRKYCIYTDSMSVLEALENYNDRCHPVVCKILDITSRLYSKGFDIVFCWLPSHVGIIGNEQADSAAKSATTHLPLAVPLSDMKRVIMHHIFNIWQESWSQQLDNKLHSVKPVVGAWPVMPMRRTDVKLTRLRIEARKLIVPQTSHTYAQAAKSSNKTSSTQTDENITKIKCPSLELLQSLSSKTRTNLSISTPDVSTSSSSTQAQLLPSTSSISTGNSESQPPIPTCNAAPSNNMVTPIESSSSIIPTSSSQSVIQPPSASNTVQDARKLAKARSRKRKKELLKKMKEAIIDIKMNPHRPKKLPKKPASDEYTTDEEEMIVYDVEDEIEANPDYVKENECFSALCPYAFAHGQHILRGVSVK
ncbi:RNase H domain-containing protein [Trichonephila clavipes]|nr:RNase H domain-containing protein [Trichonephila clavipes]